MSNLIKPNKPRLKLYNVFTHAVLHIIVFG